MSRHTTSSSIIDTSALEGKMLGSDDLNQPLLYLFHYVPKREEDVGRATFILVDDPLKVPRDMFDDCRGGVYFPALTREVIDRCLALQLDLPLVRSSFDKRIEWVVDIIQASGMPPFDCLEKALTTELVRDAVSNAAHQSFKKHEGKRVLEFNPMSAEYMTFTLKTAEHKKHCSKSCGCAKLVEDSKQPSEHAIKSVILNDVQK
ncbi:hypothetical protein K466DRAFT_631774 [Polyporus arcularius HHB13444]|uniref:Uncharacterized protein n=1 Tax=Polyporus arcularius HHB13444 TaxID=1314778 RepID=A0A5C3NWZ2_9APHY|nr:hypothetical protein K466DRAFT_631774 [Polyporus arcularius HHB13444]